MKLSRGKIKKIHRARNQSGKVKKNKTKIKTTLNNKKQQSINLRNKTLKIHRGGFLENRAFSSIYNGLIKISKTISDTTRDARVNMNLKSKLPNKTKAALNSLENFVLLNSKLDIENRLPSSIDFEGERILTSLEESKTMIENNKKLLESGISSYLNECKEPIQKLESFIIENISISLDKIETKNEEVLNNALKKKLKSVNKVADEKDKLQNELSLLSQVKTEQTKKFEEESNNLQNEQENINKLKNDMINTINTREEVKEAKEVNEKEEVNKEKSEKDSQEIPNSIDTNYPLTNSDTDNDSEPKMKGGADFTLDDNTLKFVFNQKGTNIVDFLNLVIGIEEGKTGFYYSRGVRKMTIEFIVNSIIDYMEFNNVTHITLGEKKFEYEFIDSLYEKIINLSRLNEDEKYIINNVKEILGDIKPIGEYGRIVISIDDKLIKNFYNDLSEKVVPDISSKLKELKTMSSHGNYKDRNILQALLRRVKIITIKMKNYIDKIEKDVQSVPLDFQISNHSSNISLIGDLEKKDDELVKNIKKILSKNSSLQKADELICNYIRSSIMYEKTNEFTNLQKEELTKLIDIIPAIKEYNSELINIQNNYRNVITHLLNISIQCFKVLKSTTKYNRTQERMVNLNKEERVYNFKLALRILNEIIIPIVGYGFKLKPDSNISTGFYRISELLTNSGINFILETGSLSRDFTLLSGKSMIEINDDDVISFEHYRNKGLLGKKLILKNYENTPLDDVVFDFTASKVKTQRSSFETLKTIWNYTSLNRDSSELRPFLTKILTIATENGTEKDMKNALPVIEELSKIIDKAIFNIQHTRYIFNNFIGGDNHLPFSISESNFKDIMDISLDNIIKTENEENNIYNDDDIGLKVSISNLKKSSNAISNKEDKIYKILNSDDINLGLFNCEGLIPLDIHSTTILEYSLYDSVNTSFNSVSDSFFL